jgi:hypothetical protein
MHERLRAGATAALGCGEATVFRAVLSFISCAGGASDMAAQHANRIKCTRYISRSPLTLLIRRGVRFVPIRLLIAMDALVPYNASQILDKVVKANNDALVELAKGLKHVFRRSP